MTSPILAVPPAGTRMWVRVPDSKASCSMTALSVSISTSTSPAVTVLPIVVVQEVMVPSSMVSERRGMRISIMSGSPG